MEDYLNIKSTISQQSLVGSFFILTVHTHTDKLHETNCFKYSDSRTDGLLYCVHNCLYNRTLPDASQGLSKPNRYCKKCRLMLMEGKQLFQVCTDTGNEDPHLREMEFFLTLPLAYAVCEYLQIWLFNK